MSLSLLKQNIFPHESFVKYLHTFAVKWNNHKISLDKKIFPVLINKN